MQTPNLQAPRYARHLSLICLTLLTLFIHGYHPYAEDGGIYAASVEYRLQPSLFPHDAAFADAHGVYSLFDPLLVATVRLSHLPLPWALLLAHLACLWLLLYAACRLGQQCFPAKYAGFLAAATLAASYTLPVAGTSLFLMEPYLTARSFSTPLSLLAIALLLEALGPNSQDESDPTRANLTKAALCLAAAAALHPLMAFYATALCTALLIASLTNVRARRTGFTALAVLACAVALILRLTASAETPAMLAAELSRSYWFLCRWQWFEWLGLAGPVLVFTLLLRYFHRSLSPSAATLCRACIAHTATATLVAILFAQEHAATHLVARLQPLRAMLPVYAVMIVLLGALLGHCVSTATDARSPHAHKSAWAALFLLTVSTIMFCVQRHSFPASRHLELPNRAATNSWARAFVWARNNTPPNAFFALDADYMAIPGEDAQTFRALAQRSTLCDFSKDGGIAAIEPHLAAAWQAQSAAQTNLSALDDGVRDVRLDPFGVTWMVLQSTARTTHVCPYDNGTVKVCSLAGPPAR